MQLRVGLILFAIIIAGALLAAYAGGFIGGKPPLPKVTAGGDRIPVSQSSYCWGNECADYADAKSMLEDKRKTAVAPGATIKIAYKGVMRFDPNKLHVTQQASDGSFSEVKLDGKAFSAPKEPGLYYYAVSGWWKQGSSSGVFAIEVK